MRQYNAAGGNVQVPKGEIYVWRKAERQEIDTRIGKANAVLRELYRSVRTRRELSNTAKLSVFKSIFVPILYLWSWILGNDVKNINLGVSIKVGIFETSPRCGKGAYKG